MDCGSPLPLLSAGLKQIKKQCSREKAQESQKPAGILRLLCLFAAMDFLKPLQRLKAAEGCRSPGRWRAVLATTSAGRLQNS
jgi:hypothetical protein